MGIFYNFRDKGKAGVQKVEQLMNHIEYRETQVFKDPLLIDYSDGYISFQGKLLAHNLFDLNSSEEIYKKVITPALDLFRG